MHQVGDQPRFYYDARSTKHEDKNCRKVFYFGHSKPKNSLHNNMFARKDNSIGNTSPSPTRPLLCSYDGPTQEIKAIVPAIKQFRRSSSCSIDRTYFFLFSVNNNAYTFQHHIVTVTAFRHYRRIHIGAGIRV